MNKPSIFLSGGGAAKDSSVLDKLYIASLEKRKILYIPSAMKRSIVGYEACYDWIVDTLSVHTSEHLDISMYADLSEIDKSTFLEFNSIYIGGGNTYKLLDEMKKAELGELLRSFLSNGGVVYGGSAGAIVLGERIDIVEQERDRDIDITGFRMLSGFAVVCHYEKNQFDKISKFAKNTGCRVLAIPEKAGIIVFKDKMKAIGKVYVIDLNGQVEISSAEVAMNHV